MPVSGEARSWIGCVALYDFSEISAVSIGANIPQPADSKIAPEGAAYCYQPDTPQPTCIEWNICAIRNKGAEPQNDCPPICRCREILAV